MSQEHANSYTVDTSGHRRVLAHMLGNPAYQSRTTKIEWLFHLMGVLQEQVKRLEDRERVMNMTIHQMHENAVHTGQILQQMATEIQNLKMR